MVDALLWVIPHGILCRYETCRMWDAAMGGETEQTPSGWTVDTLHAYFQHQIDARDAAIHDLLDERDHRYQERFESQQEAVAQVRNDMSHRFASVNEFRATLSEQAALFIPRIEAESRIAANAALTRGVESRLDKLEGRTGGSASTIAYVFGALGAVATVIGIVAGIIALVH